MIPIAVPNLTGREREYLNKCIDTTFVSSVGEFVTRLENLVAEKSGSSYGVATSAGTTGLHLALMGVGVKRDDMVIIPSFTFIATANAVAHCGAIPWLMDVSEEDWCMDIDLLEKELKEKTSKVDGKLVHRETGRRVAAIMPVYVLGNVPDMDRLNKVAKEFGLPVVADAACAIGATREGRELGGLADVSVFSFNGNKTITCGGGGAVVGNDEELLKEVKHISTTARVGSEYDFDEVGYNYRMTNIQAAVGCAQLERLEEFVEIKRNIRRRYESAFEDLHGASFFPETEGGSCWYSGVVLPEGKGIDDVRRMCAELKSEGIEARTFWKPVHLQEPYKDAEKSVMTVTESLWDRILTLPCSTGITDEELDEVVKSVKKLWK